MHKAIRDKLIVLEDSTKVSEIIFVSRSSEIAATSGTVVSAGSMVDEVKVGERVAFAKFAGFPLPMGDKVYRIITQQDIQMVVDPEEKSGAEVKFHSDMVAKSVIVGVNDSRIVVN